MTPECCQGTEFVVSRSSEAGVLKVYYADYSRTVGCSEVIFTDNPLGWFGDSPKFVRVKADIVKGRIVEDRSFRYERAPRRIGNSVPPIALQRARIGSTP